MENINSMVVVVMCLLAMHFSFIQCTHFDDLKEEVNALIAFKSKLAHPSKCLSSWDESLADASTWLHVTANNDNSVIRIDLEDCQLEGPLASELGQLKNLTYLELYNNKLNGSIPENLGNLASLLSLDLYGNKLDGSIPEELGNLANLRFLRLNDNDLSGQVPIKLSTLVNLQIVNLTRNSDLCGWNADKDCT